MQQANLEHVDRVKTLESQVNELAGTKKKLKQKFKLREQAWLEKTRSINEEYETLLVECDSNQKVLAAYKEQYEGIRKVSSAGDIENAGHPYSFSVCVARLDTKLLHSNHDIEMLRRENLKLTEAIASKIQLVDSNCLAKENLLEEKSGLTSTIDELLREIADLSQNNCSLEQQLTDALSAKTDSANKLKKIANAYQTMIKS